MKQILTLIILIYSFPASAQFAIVYDKDSSLNVRMEASASSKIIDKLPHGHLIFCFSSYKNQTFINFTYKGKVLNGYVYQDQYKLINSYYTIPIVLKKDNFVVLKKDSFQITITQSKFEKKNHTFKHIKNSPELIELIDGQRYWGTNGVMPKTQFEKVELKIGEKIILLPSTALAGLYQPSIYYVKANYDASTDTFYIQSMNSDGAGAYDVIWKIEKGLYTDRFIAYGF